MLYRLSRDSSASARGPYVPLATIAVGLLIAYRSFSDFATLDGLDITIMFLFVFGLFSLMGLQFFIVDKHKRPVDVEREGNANKD